MELEIKHLLAILSSPELRKETVSSLSDPACTLIPLHKLSEVQYAALHDAAFDVWINDAPVVEEFIAEQDKGIYSINIHGIPGAYFVKALEYDNQGPFDSIDDAQSFVRGEWGEFIVEAKDELMTLFTDDEEFQRLKKKRIWLPWEFLVSGEWSESPYHQGTHTFMYSLSKDGGLMRIMRRGFPSEILAIAHIGKNDDLGQVASKMLGEIRAKFNYWIEFIHDNGDLELDI